MELRHLRYFRAVAERLSFSRAAEELRVAQPALSRQVKALEEELGVRLLDRNRVRVQLTDAGRTFYAHACKVLAQVDIALAATKETATGTGGELIICNDWRLSNPIVLGAIAEYRQCYPRIEVSLQDLLIHEQLTALRSRQAHLGFVAAQEFAANDELQSLRLLEAELLVTVGAQHRLAAAGRIRIADLAGETWVITGAKETPGLREFIVQTCRLSGFNPNFAPPVHTIESVLARVATGYGVCLWPDFLTTSFPSNPLVRYLHSDCPPIELRAVWHRREDSRLLQQFLGILRRRVAEAAPTMAKSGAR